MDTVRVIRSAITAGVLAGLFARYGLLGAILSGAAGCLALILLPRRPDTTLPMKVAKPSIWDFLPWIVCTGLFATFVVALSPLIHFPGISMALLLFSPLFGTIVLLIESTVYLTTGRDRTGDPMA